MAFVYKMEDKVTLHIRDESSGEIIRQECYIERGDSEALRQFIHQHMFPNKTDKDFEDSFQLIMR